MLQSTQARAPCCTALRIAYSDRALPRVSTSIALSKTEAASRSTPFAYACLQDDALVPLVERAVESLHARMERMHLRPASVYVCAMLRHSQTLELLRSSQDVYGVCVRVWRSRTFLKDLFALRQFGALHDRSKRLDWIRCVYQTSLADQFEDLPEPVLQKALWHVAVAHTRLRGVA